MNGRPPYRIDMHTHSIGSADGALTLHDYRTVMERGVLHAVAITDHGTTAYARYVRQELSYMSDFMQRIIIGREFMTARPDPNDATKRLPCGELIGLYIEKDVIPDGLTPAETADAIHAQRGLVVVPHPFETARSGMQAVDLDEIACKIDIIEGYNGRAVFPGQNKGGLARAWADRHNKPVIAGSDAHGIIGFGRTYTMLPTLPDARTLVRLLSHATLHAGTVGPIGALYPTYNRARRRMGWRPEA